MKNKVLTYSISASLLIVALSVAYYFVFYMPKQNELKLKREEEKEEQQRISEATKKIGKTRITHYVRVRLVLIIPLGGMMRVKAKG